MAVSTALLGTMAFRTSQATLLRSWSHSPMWLKHLQSAEAPLPGRERQGHAGVLLSPHTLSWS